MPPGIFLGSQAVEIARTTRDGFVESRHLGSAVVFGPDGEERARHGNPDVPVYPRSALKPYIAMAVMTNGVTLRGEDAAIATGSHTGTPLHVTRVRGLLSRAGLDESALQCSAALPTNEQSAQAVLAAGGRARPIYMGCSGKHAALLLACVTNGWSTRDYLNPEHEVWVRVREVAERLTGERASYPSTDGCGTPLFALSLVGLATGIQKIAMAKPSSPFALYREAAALAEAMRENPILVAGPDEAETVVMERLGVVSKLGFEGIQTMATPSGFSVAVKTLDGSLRAGIPVALSLLAEHGAINRAEAGATLEAIAPRFWGGPRSVGRVRPSLGAFAQDD